MVHKKAYVQEIPVEKSFFPFEDRLRFYLEHKTWPKDVACLILAGMVPEKHEMLPGHVSYPTFEGAFMNNDDNIEMARDLDALYSSDPSHKESASPSYWIEWAQSNGFVIPWFSWAKNKGLIENRPAAEPGAFFSEVQEGFQKSVDKTRLTAALKHYFRFDHLAAEEGIAVLLGIHPIEENIKTMAAFRETDNPLEAKSYFELFLMGEQNATLWPKGDQPYMEREANSGKIGRLVRDYYMFLNYWRSGKHPEQTPLSYFVKWSVCKGIEPAWLCYAEELELTDFSRAIGSAEKAMSDRGSVMDIDRSHMSDKLAILNQASQKWWRNADRLDRTTHPSKNDVMDWLMERGFSKKLADSAATIIRPEWVPIGKKPDE